LAGIRELNPGRTQRGRTGAAVPPRRALPGVAGAVAAPGLALAGELRGPRSALACVDVARQRALLSPRRSALIAPARLVARVPGCVRLRRAGAAAPLRRTPGARDHQEAHGFAMAITGIRPRASFAVARFDHRARTSQGSEPCAALAHRGFVTARVVRNVISTRTDIETSSNIRLDSRSDANIVGPRGSISSIFWSERAVPVRNLWPKLLLSPPQALPSLP
jgi:hypothetical protein